MKGKKKAILIEIGIAMGIGFGLSAFSSPFLSSLGGIILLFLVPGALALLIIGEYRGFFDIRTLVLSIGISLGITPLTLFIGGRLYRFSRSYILLSLATLFVLLILGSLLKKKERKDIKPIARSEVKWLIIITLVLTLLVYLSIAFHGYEDARGVHRTAVSDWMNRMYVGLALLNSNELPPGNPYIADPYPMEYFYFFHIMGAALVKIAHLRLDILSTLFALALLLPFLLVFTFYLLAREYFGEEKPALLTTATLSLVGGFDIVFVFIHIVKNLIVKRGISIGLNFATIRALIPSKYVDFWADLRAKSIHSFYVNLIWVPQHIAGFIVAVIYLFLLLRFRRTGGRGYLVIGGLLIASAPALSSYVTLGLAVGLFIFFLIELALSLWEKRWKEELTFLLITGIIGGLLALPFILTLKSNLAKPQLVFKIAGTGGLLNGALFAHFFGESNLTNLLDAPLYYFFEFGPIIIFGVLGLLLIRRKAFSTPFNRLLLSLIFGGGILMTFFRPGYSGPNNVIVRVALIVWAALALFATHFFAGIDDLSRRFRSFIERYRTFYHLLFATALLILLSFTLLLPLILHRAGIEISSGRVKMAQLFILIVGMIIWGILFLIRKNLKLISLFLAFIGFSAVIYSACGIFLESYYFWITPKVEYQAYHWIYRMTPLPAKVQPKPIDFTRRLAWYGKRRTAFFDPRYSRVFLTREKLYEDVLRLLNYAFETKNPKKAHHIFRSLGVDYIVIYKKRESHYPNREKFEAGRFFIPVFENREIEVIKVIAQPLRKKG